jgi:beta-galactosidase
VTKADLPWAPKGHEISWEQWALPVAAAAAPASGTRGGGIAAPALAMETWGRTLRFTGPEFALVFDRLFGVISSYSFRDVRLLERGPVPDFWRAMTDNDLGAWKNVGYNARKDPKLDIVVWRAAAASRTISDVQSRRIDAATAEVVVTAALPLVDATFKTTYTISGSGDVVIEGTYTPGSKPQPMMPRFGMELVVSPGLEKLAWYGRGPGDTYIDRAFERVGVYSSTVAEQWFDFARPQENGNKIDVRWVALSNSDGIGLVAVGAPLLSVGASHVTKDDIEGADYSIKLPRRPEIYLNLDLRQMGVGGIDSWSRNAYPMESYRIPPDKAYSYKYRLSPFAGDVSAKVTVPVK